MVILSRIPRASLWLWLNLLLFTISNQSLPGSVEEDAVNKRWRPIPSKRIRLANARRLLLVIIPAVFGILVFLGAPMVSVALMVFTWMYNDLGGADNNFFIRNLLNLFRFVSYSLGAIGYFDRRPALFIKRNSIPLARHYRYNHPHHAINVRYPRLRRRPYTRTEYDSTYIW